MDERTDCIFCKIIAGDIPSVQLLEDDHALAFLDIHPLAPGHALLIPKVHYETMDELPAETAGAMFRHLPRLADAVVKATNAPGYNILQCNHEVAGQEVPHIHVHVIPRRKGDGLGYRWAAGKYPEGELEKLADTIRKQL